MGIWTTEVEPQKRWGCIGKAKYAGMRFARKFRRPIRVTYHGSKQQGNRQINCTDFTIDGRGRVDPTVDPTWWTHKG